MNKQFTANDVRRLSNRIPRNNDEIADAQEALRAYADRLEADEKAEPIYQWQHRPMHHPEYWKDCRNKEEWDHKRNSLPEAVFRIVYTNPSSPDADRLAEALRDDEHEWPASLNIRDTKLHDDMGGPGQRIYTTAGRGYKTMKYIRHDLAHSAQAQPPAVSVTDAPVPVFSWQPIETAPKNNKRPLFLARFNDDGSLQSFDYDASWMSESESWEIPEVYFFWASANGNVEEPTHWAYQPAGFDKIEAVLAAQENPNV